LILAYCDAILVNTAPELLELKTGNYKYFTIKERGCMQKTIEAITYDFYGDLFIDIGGNVGMWTTEMVDLYGKCIFVEP
jgi:hypothetical protein